MTETYDDWGLCRGVLWFKRLGLYSDEVISFLRVLAAVVVVTEEGENTDDQTHHQENRQGDPEKSLTPGNPGTNATKKDQDLLHPPARTHNM